MKSLQCFLVVLLISSSCIQAQFSTNVESGILFPTSNVIRNCADGTTFSLTNQLETDSGPFLRIRFSYLKDNRDYFSVLLAPLKVTAAGSINNPIRYDGFDYQANAPLEAVYQFNSYRFTYNRRLIRNDNFNFGVGMSLKIRDAGSSLRNSEIFREDFGVGFVPLINIISNWHFSEKASLQFFGDGLAVSRGRAFDLAFMTNFKVNSSFEFNLGYRLLEGGNNGTSNYNFVTFHYAVIGLTCIPYHF